MIYIYLKDILSIFLPFVFIHLFFQYFYQTSLFTVVVWWFKYFSKMDYAGVLLIGVLFTFFAFWLSIGSIIQNISLAFHGEEHKMIYAGNISENKSLFYHAKDLSLPPVKEYNFTPPALTFKNIYRETIFVRDKGTERLGVVKQQFSFGSLLQVLWVMLILTPIFLAVLHALAYPVAVNAENHDFSPIIPLGDAFTAKLAQFGISPLKLIAFPIIMIFLPVLLPSFSDKTNERFIKNRTLTLPINIKANYQTDVLPVHTFREIIDNISHGPDTDTGMRTIIFKFEAGFTLPVYIAYKYDATQFPELEKLADNNIKHGVLMKVKILDDLSLDLVR